MANSILKLKVESSEYDAKLKKAAEGIRHLADVAHKGGGELTGLEKAELDYIKALGDMETKSRTASGQLRELSSSYKELKVVYDQLNEVEKADEGGKALAASLETLKQRAQEAKAQLDTATNSLNDNGEAGKGTSSILEVLKDKFTINIDALTLFNKGLQVAEVALNVAKDAFFASEATVDEWGRIVDSSKSLYEGFLTALNTGDISGYLGRIDEIVTAARKAYDELDRLGTMKTIQAPKMSAQQTENERMRMMIQTGRYIAPVDGRRASMKDGQLLTPEQIRILERQLQNGMKNVVALVGNEVKQTGKAIDAVYNRQAQELGMSLKEFRKGTSSMAEFDKRMAGYEQYQKWRNENYYTDNWGNRRVKEGNPYEEYKKWGTFRVDGERYNDLVRLIQQRDQQAGQAYSMQSQAYRTMNRAEGVTVSKLMKGETAGSGSGGGGKGGKTEDEAAIGSIDYQTKKVQELQKAWQAAADDDSRRKIKEEIESAQAVLDNMTGKVFDTSNLKQIAPMAIAAPKMELTDPMGTVNTMKQSIKLELKTEAVKVDETTLQTMMKDAVQNGINGMDFQFNAIGKKIGAGLDVPDSAWEGILEQYNALREQIGLEPITIDFKTGNIKNVADDGKKLSKEWQAAGSAIQAVGSAMSQIEDPAAKVMGTVAQAIATIALTFAKSLEKTFTPWDWIAAAAAGTATMISTISAIHSATGYTNGGVIKGNSYSGDKIGGMVDGGAGGFVGLNAGEIVLNQAQTANVANALEGGGMRGIDLSAKVNGEQIVLVANRYFKRTGQGEIVTWK